MRRLLLLLLASANTAAEMYLSKGNFIVEGFEDDFDDRRFACLARLFANGTSVAVGSVSMSANCFSCEGNMNVYIEVISESRATAQAVNDRLGILMPEDDLAQSSLYVDLCKVKSVVQRLYVDSVQELADPASPPQPPESPPQPGPPPLGPPQDESSSAAPRKSCTLCLGLLPAALFGLVYGQVVVLSPRW